MSNPAQPATSLSKPAQDMIAQFKAIDPTRAGIGLNVIRPFYPRVGWNVILATVNELEKAGILTKSAVINNKGLVGYHKYTLKAGV